MKKINNYSAPNKIISEQSNQNQNQAKNKNPFPKKMNKTKPRNHKYDICKWI